MLVSWRKYGPKGVCDLGGKARAKKLSTKRVLPRVHKQKPPFLLLAIRQSRTRLTMGDGCQSNTAIWISGGKGLKDAHSSTIHITARAQLAGYSAFYGQHLLLYHARSDAAPPQQASPPNVHTDSTRPACGRIRVCNDASLGYGAYPSYNRPPVACFGLQKDTVKPPRRCGMAPHQIAAKDRNGPTMCLLIVS